MERSRLRTIRGFAIGILAGLVLASAGVASAKQGRGLGPSPEVISLVTDEPDATDACVDEAEPSEDLPDLTSEGDVSDADEGESEESDEGESEESDEGESEESDEGESEESDEGESEESDEGDQECPPAEESDEDEPEPTDGEGPDEERQAQCEEAAGLSDEDGDGEDGEDGSDEEVKGLDHAIEVVLANCIKNPQAPGLLNALRHLAENRERKMARDEAKAERRAAHSTGKGHGKGH